MVTQNFYLPSKAAEVLGIPVKEVLRLIESGQLKATYLHNVADWMISHNDVVEYLKQTKDFKTIQKVLTHRVLLVDRDPDFQDLVKMELERRKNIQVKIATSERDVKILLDEFLPDILLVHLAATLRQADRISESLGQAKARKKAHVVVYHAYSPEGLESKIEVKEQLRKSGADEIISIHGGARPLIEAVLRKFGMKS